MATGQKIFDTHFIARAATAAACLMLLSGCMAHAAKDKQLADVAEASEPVPVVMRTPGEQLAAELNAKAQLQAQKQSQKPGQYRDPQVRTASGQQMVAQQQSATGLYPAPPQTLAPASAAMAPANIGGLVTQPTAVNASRSSIYAAPAPIAVNPDGTLAPISAYAAPGAAPSLRSVYSLPPGTLPEQPQAVIVPPQAALAPQASPSSQGAMPHYAPQVASASGGRPTSDATPSRILPAPGSKGRHIDSAEALMMARNLASGGKNAPANTMMPQASSGLTLPQGVALPPGVTLTPGMAASLR